MGVSTDAVHFYGVPIDADSEAHEIVHDWLNSDEIDGEPKDWFKQRGINGVTVGYHCSDNYVMYYLAIAESEVTAYRGSPMRVGVDMGSTRGWDVRLRHALQAIGITVDKPFDWWIASWWSG